MMGNYRREHVLDQLVLPVPVYRFQIALTLCQFRASQRFTAHTTHTGLVYWSLVPASRAASQ